MKGLHGLSSQELSRLIREAENNILQHIPENGLNIQVGTLNGHGTVLSSLLFHYG